MITQDKVFIRLVRALETYENMTITCVSTITELPVVKVITLSEKLLCKKYGLTFNQIENITKQHRARIAKEQH